MDREKASLAIAAAATLALTTHGWSALVDLYLTADRSSISATNPTVNVTLWARVINPSPQDVGFATVRPAGITTTNGQGGTLALAPGLTSAFIATKAWSQGFSSNGSITNVGSPSISAISGFQDAPNLFGLGGAYINPNFDGSLDIAVYRFSYTAADFTTRTVNFDILAPVNNYIAAVYTSAHGASRNIRAEDASVQGTSVHVTRSQVVPLPGTFALAAAGLGLLAWTRRRTVGV